MLNHDEGSPEPAPLAVPRRPIAWAIAGFLATTIAVTLLMLLLGTLH